VLVLTTIKYLPLGVASMPLALKAPGTNTKSPLSGSSSTSPSMGSRFLRVSATRYSTGRDESVK
jgi:hypothetical protein